MNRRTHCIALLLIASAFLVTAAAADVLYLRAGEQELGQLEKMTTGASCPWNLSTVPTGTSAGISSRSRLTCALKGATTIISAASTPAARSRATSPATRSASARDSCRQPSCPV